MNSYEQKQADRKERYESRSASLKEKSSAMFKVGSDALKEIPFGQPMMPDHHSYKSDKAYRGRAVGKIEKSFEISDKAAHYARKAESVGKGGISSDDPDAVVKLKEKLGGLERLQVTMKSMNAQARKNKEEKPCPTWQLSNNNANIRTVTKRIKDLEDKKNMEVREEVVTDLYTMREDLEDNRILFIFEGKPEDEVRSILKSHGFRWSPNRSAWVRQLTANGRYSTNRVISKLDELSV